MMLNISLVLVVLASIGKVGESIRCYECRSDILANCGDPFFSGSGVSIKDCDDQSLNPTVMCYKSSLYVGGQYVTIRGCAPFDTEFFTLPMQRGMRGTYWRGWGSSFSFCDYHACNGSVSVKISGQSRFLAILMSCILVFFEALISNKVRDQTVIR